MAQTVTVPDLTLQSDHKIVVANTPNDGDPVKLWYPPFYLDWNGFDDSDPLADGMVAMVAYRADNPFNYTQVHVPVETEALRYTAIPSIVEGLVITKTSDTAIAVSTGKVRFLSHDEWQEETVPAFARTVPSTEGSYYIIAIDAIHNNAPHNAKIDMHSFGIIFGDAEHTKLLEAIPYAAAATQSSPALIVGKIDVDSNGKIIQIWNSGLHAGLLPQKMSDFMEVVGVAQHNIEVVLGRTSAEFELNALPYRMLRFTIDINNSIQYGKVLINRVRTGYCYELDGQIINKNLYSHRALSTLNRTSDPADLTYTGELYKVDTNREGTGGTFHQLGANEFCLHLLYVKQNAFVDATVELLLIRAQNVFTYKDSSLDSDNIPKVYPWMLEASVGNMILPRNVIDNAALCGFLLISDKTTYAGPRYGFSGVTILPAAQEMSSIQDMPSAVDAPDVSLNGLAAVKTDKGIKPAGLVSAKDGSLYVKNNGHFTNIPSGINSFTQLSFTRNDATKDFGWNKYGAISAADLAAIKAALEVDVLFDAANNDLLRSYGVKWYGVTSSGAKTINISTRNISDTLKTIIQDDSFNKAFGAGVTPQNVLDGIVHCNIRLTVAHPSFDYVNTTDIDFNGIQTTDFIDNLFFYSHFYSSQYSSNDYASVDNSNKYIPSTPYLSLYYNGLKFISITVADNIIPPETQNPHLLYIDSITNFNDITTQRNAIGSGIIVTGYDYGFTSVPQIMQLCVNPQPFLQHGVPQGAYLRLDTVLNIPDEQYYSNTSTHKLFIGSLLAPPRTQNLGKPLPAGIKLLGYNTPNTDTDNRLLIQEIGNREAGFSLMIPDNFLNYKLFKNNNIPADTTIDYRVDIEIYSIK